MNSKKKVEFSRMTRGVETVTVYVDDDIDLSSLTPIEAHQLIEDSGGFGVNLSHEIYENDYPHNITEFKEGSPVFHNIEQNGKCY